MEDHEINDLFAALVTEATTLFSHHTVVVKQEPSTEQEPCGKKEEVNAQVKQEPKESQDQAVKNEPKNLLASLLGDVYVTKVQPAKSPVEICSSEVSLYRQYPTI